LRISRLLLSSIAALCVPSASRAYTLENAAGAGCHESMTASALRTVRGELTEAAPISATDDERALIDDLQFRPDDDMRDLGGATLLIAVRDNDLKGRGANDLTQLAAVHGNPETQREHCLRAPEQTEPGGSQAALDDCKSFIRMRFEEALDGLDANGNVDASKRTTLSLHLALRGDVDASLPTFHVRLGQALHALQDSFSHTYRSADGKKVVTVLNWVQFVGGELVESRDGPPHSKALDECDDANELIRRRRELATTAATSVMRVAFDSTKTREQKLTELDGIFAEYLSYQAGCSADNSWCQAPEAALKDSSSCACNEVHSKAGSSSALFFALFAGLILACVRWRPSLLAIAVIISPAIASAQEPAQDPARPVETSTSSEQKPTADDEGRPLTPEEREAIPAPPTRPVAEPGSHDPDEVTYGFYVAASGSIDQSALAASVGGRIRLARSWTFGIDAEWNPWINLNTTEIRGGTLNGFGTAIFRIPLAYENFNLRITGNAGASYLLTTLYGAPSGSVGLYFGLCPLGLEWKMSRLFYLVINPISISLPIPQLRGVPLIYPQYRLSIGLEFDT
jgi:hypothetical protein